MMLGRQGYPSRLKDGRLVGKVIVMVRINTVGSECIAISMYI